MHIGKGTPDDSCQVGVPSGVNIANRHFVVDETIGAVVAFCTFGAGSASGGGSGAPDTHLFRVENGKLRFVHTLTHCCRRMVRAAAAEALCRAGAVSERPPLRNLLQDPDATVRQQVALALAASANLLSKGRH